MAGGGGGGGGGGDQLFKRWHFIGAAASLKLPASQKQSDTPPAVGDLIKIDGQSQAKNAFAKTFCCAARISELSADGKTFTLKLVSLNHSVPDLDVSQLIPLPPVALAEYQARQAVAKEKRREQAKRTREKKLRLGQLDKSLREELAERRKPE